MIEQGLKLNVYRDKDSPYLFVKLYIPYDLLSQYSEFKFEEENQYTSVQRAYAIDTILHGIVSMCKPPDAEYKRYDFQRFVDEGICVGLYIPHEDLANEELLQDWAKLRNTFKPVPIEKIKDYFGAEIAIHFAWLHFSNCGMLCACVCGIIGYLISLWFAYGEFDYPVEEVCAGVYDYYPRCPLCSSCNYSLLSSSCRSRRAVRSRCNLFFAMLMSVWVMVLFVTFQEYIRKIQVLWEKPTNECDVDVFHTSIVVSVFLFVRTNLWCCLLIHALLISESRP